MPTLLWLPEAKSDIARLHEFLHEKSSNAAQRMVDVLLQGADQLLSFPEIGKLLEDELQRRELFLSFGAGSYVLRYRLDKENIVVMRVWHSRESR